MEAADKANEAADKAESNATAAQTAANTANEKAELAAQAASDANAAKEEAEAATQSANNAASNAEEKAAAANTAAQDAEKVANNPTYIGTDHYVYVYNKETDSFDKTGIYCKGEPGSSFRIAGEYATLEALKSAVPDGSAVDGFMAVGTEAPYDYYAWRRFGERGSYSCCNYSFIRPIYIRRNIRSFWRQTKFNRHNKRDKEYRRLYCRGFGQ